MIHNVLEYIKGERIWLIDNESRTSAGFSERKDLVYGADYITVSAMLKEIEREISVRKEDYEDARLDNVAMTLQEFTQQTKPMYVVVDIIQELYAMLGKEGKTEEMDVLEEASRWGIYVIVTSEPKIPMRSGKFMDMLSSSKSGIILGNIKEQKVFDYTGIREENRQAEYGYQHTNGINRKMLVARHIM